MKLTYQTFEDLYSLTGFVNFYGIKKENIQAILRNNNNYYVLLYWE